MCRLPVAGGRHDWVLAVPALAGLVACRGAGVPGPGGPGPALVAALWSSGRLPRPGRAGPGFGPLRGTGPRAVAAAGLPLVAPLCLRCALLSVGSAAAAAGAGPGPGCGSDSGPLGPQPARTARTRLRSGPGPAPRPLGWCRLVAWPLGVPARLASGQPGKRSRSPPQSGCAGQLPRPAPHGMADKRPGRAEAVICPGPGRRGSGKVAAGGGVPWTA